VTVFEGDPIQLSVRADGRPPLTYQWKKGGVDIGGATRATYSPLSTLAAAGNYTVAVTGAVAPPATSSPPAIIIVKVDLTAPTNTAFLELGQWLTSGPAGRKSPTMNPT
jgi:hypothetical protein